MEKQQRQLAMVMPSGGAAPRIGTARAAVPRLKEAVGKNRGLAPELIMGSAGEEEHPRWQWRERGENCDVERDNM